MNETTKTGILTANRLSRMGRAAMAAGVLTLALAWPGTVLADGVTLNANSAMTGGVSMVSTPVISTNGTGTGSAANPWVYAFAPNSGTFSMSNYALTNANGSSFTLDLNGMAMTGTSGKTNLLTGRPAGAGLEARAGSVTILNASTIAIGAINTHIYYGAGTVCQAGSITVGTTSAPVGNFQADSLDAGAGYMYVSGAGAITVYGTGNVTIATSGGAAGNISTWSEQGPSGAINIQNRGSFTACDVLAYATNLSEYAGKVTLAGNGTGAFQVHTIDASRKRVDGGPRNSLDGAITIRGYTNVLVSGDLLNYVLCSGYVDGNYRLGDIAITNCGSIQLNGQIDCSDPNLPAQTNYWGNLVLQSTGAITLANLDLGKMRSASLSASNNATISGDLIGFPTNAPANGKLDAATNTTIYYIWNTPNNTYLKNTNYTLKSGGKLVAQVADIPVVANAAVSNVTTTSAIMNGYLNATGRTPTTVSVLWGTKNGGTSAAAWANTNTFATGQWNAGDYPTTNITTLAPNTNYYYTYYGSEAGGSMVAPNPVSFITGELTVLATTPTCRVTPGDTGVFTVSRPAGCTNEDLVVNYTLGGTATNVTDYVITPASGSVIIPKGQANGTITIAPVIKYDSLKTVVLTLTNGPYALVSATPATCTLAAMGPITSDVTLTGTSALTSRVSMVSTPVITINGASPGAGTVANPWFYSFVPYANGTFIMSTNKLKPSNGNSFKLDLNGLAVTGTSGYTNLLGGREAGASSVGGSITLVNAGAISIGAISTYLSTGGGYPDGGAGSITLGTAALPVGNLRVDSIDSGAGNSFCGLGGGSINVYGTSNVYIRNAGGTAGNLSSVAVQGPAGAITVQHNGSFAANDILTYTGVGPNNQVVAAGNVSFNGAVSGGAATGSFQAHTLDASYKANDNATVGGTVNIQGYKDVTFTGDLLTYENGVWVQDYAGHITITASGNIKIDGVIDASEPNQTTPTRANLGVVSLSATGTITLANLDLGKMYTATLAAGQGTTIKGYLLNFPTSTPTNGWLDVPTNQVAYYNPNNASNAYLSAATYTLKSGGKLKMQSGGGTLFFFQ